MNFPAYLLCTASLLATYSAFAQDDPARAQCTPNYLYAQRLVDDTIAHHPELTALVIHAQPPGVPDNVVVASNIWLTGEVSDPDDMHVITSGISMTETNKAGTKFEVQGVLTNVFGQTIGSVATVFPYKQGDNKSLLEKKAAAIREELHHKVLDTANLVDPFPYTNRVPPRTFAQQLVNRIVTANPDLLVLTLEAPPPSGGPGIVLASNVGKVGKKLDTEGGAPTYLHDASGPQDIYEKELPLTASTGAAIGTMKLILHRSAGDTPTSQMRRAQAIANQVSRSFSTAATLYEPVRD